MAIPNDATINALIPIKRGRLGDVVYSRNQFGQYVRAVGNPVQPATASQTSNWANHLSIVNAWKTLRPKNQLTWNTRTKYWKRKNVFGDNKPLTGQALFIKLNRYLLTIGQPQLIQCPIPNPVQNFTDLRIRLDLTPATFTMRVIPPSPTRQSFIVYATPPVNANITWYKNKLRFIASFSAPHTPTVNLALPWFNVFGVIPLAGQKIFVKVTPISNKTGRPGVPIIREAIVQP